MSNAQFFSLKTPLFPRLSPALIPLLISYIKILILSPFSRCQSFLHTPYIKSETFSLPLQGREEWKKRGRKTRLISHQIVYMKREKPSQIFCNLLMHQQILSSAHAVFYSKSNRIRWGEVDSVDTSYKIFIFALTSEGFSTADRQSTQCVTFTAEQFSWNEDKRSSINGNDR